MRIRHRYFMVLAATLLAAAAMAARPGSATGQNDLQGWGVNDPYNYHYRAEDVESLKAWMVGFKTLSPLEGMSPATIMVVNDGTQHIDVHICPSWFATPEDIGVRIGDRVKIKGCRAEIGGREVIMAAKLKRGDFFEFKARLTRNGKPFWTFTPEELVEEIGRIKAAGGLVPQK